MKKRKGTANNYRKTSLAKIIDAETVHRSKRIAKRRRNQMINGENVVVKCSRSVKMKNSIIVKCDREMTNENDAAVNQEEIMMIKEEADSEICSQKMSVTMPIAEGEVKHKGLESDEFICFLCQKKFTDKTKMTRHMIRIHLNRKVNQFLCGVCNKVFTRRFSLKRHQVYAHEKSESCSCPRCGKIFARKDYLIKHIQETHEKIQGDRYKCEVCLKIFTRLYALKRHQSDIHESPKISVCSWCGKTFSRKFNLSRHVQVVHINSIETEFICFHCDRTYTKKHRLLFHIKKRHLEAGNDVKRMECPRCPKVFVSRFNLTRHISTVHEKMKSFECYYCSRMFSFQHNLKRHIASVHLAENDPDDKSAAAKQNHVCSKCNKTFSRHYDLTRHIRRLHSLAEDKPYICNFCDGRFPCRRTISTHIKKRHQLGTSSKILCCLCKKPCETSRNALDHYVVGHNISVEYEYPQFSSFDEFKEWMMKMEKATLCRYVKSKMYKCEADTRYVFLCHRSGFYQSKLSDRKRQMKKCGPKKLNGFCPAQIRAVSNNSDGSCHVTFLKTHVGHDVDDEKELQHIYLTEDERKGLAAKISSGVPLPRILKECHSLARESEVYKKFKTLQIRDLHNISVAYHLRQNRANLLPESLCINAFLERNEDAVLFYKQHFKPDNTYGVFEDNDVVLIVMTKFQKMMLKLHAHRAVAIYSNGASTGSFFLHTLLVLDDNNEGIVAAFALSNRNDESLINIFLTCLRSRVGSVETNILVTCAEDFYSNSWTKIMCAPQHRLYCMWHVKKVWWQNLNKITDKAKQKLVRQHLNILSREADEDLFFKKLSGFIENEDPDLRTFIEYFKTCYFPNARYWAHCYRRNAVINPDLDIEAFDKVMKYILAGDKRLRRPTDCLRSITLFISLMENDYKLKEIFGKSSFNRRLLKRLHACAIKLLEQAEVTLEIVDDSKCRIALFNDSTKHTMEKISSVNCSSALKTCHLFCKECRSCFHQYTCTCDDYIINSNMCLHIHALCIFFNNSDDPFSSLIGNPSECSDISVYEVEDYSPSSVAIVSAEAAFEYSEESYHPVTYQSTFDDENVLPPSENNTSDSVIVSSVPMVPKVEKGDVRDETQRLIDEFKSFITKKANNLSDINEIRSNFSKLLSPIIIKQKSE